MLSNYAFAGDNIPDVRVDTIFIDENEIDVITILNSFNVPFYLKGMSKRYHTIREGYIYSRIGDKNTSTNQNANIQQIEMLWKKRLGLTQPPLEQIVNRLENKLEWVENDEASYNMYKPEFALVEERDDEYGEDEGQFYIYSQTNSRFSYKDLKIMYNQTVLKEYQLIVLDSGRYKTPIPNWGYAGYDNYGVNSKYCYKYYLKDSIQYKLQQFYFDSENAEEVYAKRRFDKVILYFDNNDEKLCFESYVENKQKALEQYMLDADKEYYTIDCGDEHVKKIERHRLSSGLALNRLLVEFRAAYSL